MKLPCVLETTGGHVVCLFENGFGYHFDGQYKGFGTDCEFIIAGSDKNITAEYLANTYGEVKSKEHAEFIVKLAEVNNILVEGRNPSEANWFSFRCVSGNITLTLLSSKGSIAIDSSRKQITIPLPPECESVNEWPKVGDDVFYNGQKWTFVAKHNDMAMLFWTGDEYCTAKISELQKPKTPEQELRDELFQCLNPKLDTLQASDLATWLIENYNITKKPQ